MILVAFAIIFIFNETLCNAWRYCYKSSTKSLPERLAIYITPCKLAHSKILRCFVMHISPIRRPIQHSISTDVTIAILHIPHVHPLRIGPHLRISRRRQQIHKESQDIKSEDKRNDPFKHSRHILLLRKHGRSEHDCKRNFDENEGQFRPETEAQDEMFPEMNSQALVFGAAEDGRDDVASYEKEEKGVMEMGVVKSVEDGEED